MVVIMLLLVGMVLPSFGVGARRVLDSEAEGMRGELELARQRAIATGRPHRLALDLDAATLRIEHWATPPAEAAPPRDPREPVDLSPPRAPAGAFEPLPTKLGRTRALDEEVFIAWIETAEGATDRGAAAVSFFEDGSASAARIRLENEGGDAIELEVLPLADAVRVRALD